MKLRLFIGLMLAGAGISAQELDFGVLSQSRTLFTQGDGSQLFQENIQRIWLEYELPWLRFQSRGRFGTKTDLQADTLIFDPDLELLRLEYLSEIKSDSLNRISVSAGRMPFKVLPGLILDQALDGFTMEFTGPDWSAKMGAGYNGLLSKYSSRIILTNSDTSDQLNSNIFFASPRMLGLFEYIRQTGPGSKLTISYVPQSDLRALVTPEDRTLVQEGDPIPTLTEGGPFHTHHLAAALEGEWIPEFHWNLDGVIFAGTSLYYSQNYGSYREVPLFGGALRTGLDWNPGDKGDSQVRFKAVLTSGDTSARADFREGAVYSQDVEALHLFRDLSGLSPGFVFTPQWGNLTVYELQFSTAVATLASSKDLRLMGAFRNFRRTNDGPVSSLRVLSGQGGSNIGSELTAGTDWRPLQEFSASFSLGVFFPDSGSTGCVDPDQDDVVYRIALDLSVDL